MFLMKSNYKWIETGNTFFKEEIRININSINNKINNLESSLQNTIYQTNMIMDTCDNYQTQYMNAFLII